MHDGSTALSYDGHSVSNTQLQTAAKQISAFVGGTIDPGVVAGRLAIGPQIEKYAAKQDQSPISDSTIQAQKPKVHLSKTALEALRIDALITTLHNNGKIDDSSLQKMTEQADVTVNPRYGSWEKGKGIVADGPGWIKPTPSQQAPVPNGHAENQG